MVILLLWISACLCVEVNLLGGLGGSRVTSEMVTEHYQARGIALSGRGAPVEVFSGLEGERCGVVLGQKGSFAIHWRGGRLLLEGADGAGLESGARRLLREVGIWANGSSTVPGSLCVTHTGASQRRWDVRGHQITVAHHPGMFRTWGELSTFVKDLRVFGTNQIETAHFDGKTLSPLVNLSSVLHAAQVNVSFWWSIDTYVKYPAETEAVLKAMPRLDSMFFPGGDGGSLVWPEIKKAAAVIRKYHPAAAVLVSPQELNATAMKEFFAIIDTADVRSFLTAIAYGPHVSISFEELVRALPQGYSARQYPDICHSLSAQLAIPEWDYAWALTHGRQVINPMPYMMGNIVEVRSNGSSPTIGVGAYSEGTNDDLNKVIWSALAEDSVLSVDEVVHQYARYFFGADLEKLMVKVLLGLERNFVGEAVSNPSVLSTLAAVQEVEALANKTELASNWRLQAYIYRAYYDAYVQARLRFERSAEAMALEWLSTAPSKGSVQAIAGARNALSKPNDDPLAVAWRARAVELVAQINTSVGAEVLQSQDTQLNMGNIDQPLSNGPYLLAQVKAISHLSTESERVAAIYAILTRTDAGPGGFYDNLGSSSPADRRHLDPGVGWQKDPAYFLTPIQAGSQHSTHVPMTWLRYGQTFYDTALTLRYTNLRAEASYAVRLVYATTYGTSPEQDPIEPVRLVANGRTIIHDYQVPPIPTQVVEFDIPQSETSHGSLALACNQRPGGGGTGRTCKISEVWLVEK